MEIYYVFIPNTKTEALYLCDKTFGNSNYQINTMMYPMGSFLSKMFKTLFPWYEINFLPKFNTRELIDNADFFGEISQLYSSTINNDKVAHYIFGLLLEDNEMVTTNKFKTRIIPGEKNITHVLNPMATIEMLKLYMDYITSCDKQPNLCKTEILEAISTPHVNLLPKKHIYYGNRNEELNFSSTSAVENNDDFQDVLTKLNVNTAPIYYYPLLDAIDLIYCSIHCVFSQKHYLKQCNHCNSLFVTSKQNVKYCPVKKDIEAKHKPCYKAEKNNRAKTYAKNFSEATKMYNSLRSMFSRDDDRNKNPNFLANCSDWREKIKQKTATVEEYENWLKSQYKRKYKS